MSARSRPSLGQHFLVDRGAIERIVRALAPVENDAVLEIGPGRGALTGRLLEALPRLAVVELDTRLAALLRARHDPSRLLVFEGDVLRLDLAEVLERLRPGGAGRLVVVGNLPYAISKPIVQRLVAERTRIDRAVLMFQREVAHRVTASPSSKDYGPLSVLAGQAFTIGRLFDLGPRSFRPPPRVDSTVTHWTRRDTAMSDDEERALRRCLGACFARRRRTLRNNLRAALGDEATVDRLLSVTGIPGGHRAEQLEPASFLRLAVHWPVV